MPKIRCNQCGKVTITNNAKKCPFCGDTFKDEFTHRLRKKVKMSRGATIKILIATVIVLSLCLVAVYSQRLYSWDEPRTREIVDKTEHTYTYSETHNIGDSDDPIYVTEWHTDTDYYFYLNDSHREEVWYSTYHQYKVGDNYTYHVMHVDWKPGMKDAPIPVWVWIVPVGVLLACLIYVTYRIDKRRKTEMDEWLETGDLNIKGEEE